MDHENPYAAAADGDWWPSQDEPDEPWDEDDCVHAGSSSPTPEDPDDPASALIRTNDVPQAAYRVVIEDILQTQNAVLSKLKAEISQVHSAVREMQAKRNALISEERLLRAKIRLYQGVFSPIRRLPPEIIGEIFLNLVPVLGGNHQLPRSPRYGARVEVPVARPPWYLGHICRYWRSVALSVQCLWSVHDLRSSPPTGGGFCPSFRESSYPWEYDDVGTNEDWPNLESEQRRLSSIETCLERSRQASISLRVIYNDSPSTMLNTVKVLAGSRRLNRLVLVNPADDLLEEFHRSSAKFEQLRILAIAFTRGRPSIVFECPALVNDLTLASFTITESTRRCIPWAQLTRYCETDCTWEGPHEMPDDVVRWDSYRQMTDVVDLCVQFIDHIRIPEHPPVVLSKLQHAQFSCDRGVLKFFDMPILQSLSYNRTNSYHWSQEDLIPHLPPRLKILRLQTYPERIPGSFRDILVRCPELVEIFINVPNTTPQDLVTTLLPSPYQPALGSKLEVLRVGHLNLYDERHCDQLQRMIRFRFQESETLTRMRAFTLYDLRATDRIHQQMDDISWGYMDQGLDVSVGYNSEQFFASGHLCNCSLAGA
ncbi:hypothetical protein DFH06DRAFT_1463559 [Mycena polygramma]|nr:hypothetical protein DFH06DRAFT_1463559 [Mycena polygramma]